MRLRGLAMMVTAAAVVVGTALPAGAAPTCVELQHPTWYYGRIPVCVPI